MPLDMKRKLLHLGLKGNPALDFKALLSASIATAASRPTDERCLWL